MSQISGSHTAPSKAGSKSSKRPTLSNRQDTDYFGATAPSGPFTEENTSAATSPGYGSNRGVPATPQSPNDIAAPVEIGGRERDMSHNAVTTPGEGWEYAKGGKFREGITELE